MLTAFDLCLGACGVLLTLAGTAIDFVVDRLTGLVLLQRSWSLLRSEIAAVLIDLFLISGKKFRGHRNIMLVGSCHFYRMNQTSVYKGYKQDKIEMRGDRAEMSDFPLYLNTVAGGLDCRDQTIGGFSFVVKIYAVPVVEIIG